MRCVNGGSVYTPRLGCQISFFRDTAKPFTPIITKKCWGGLLVRSRYFFLRFLIFFNILLEGGLHSISGLERCLGRVCNLP